MKSPKRMKSIVLFVLFGFLCGCSPSSTSAVPNVNPGSGVVQSVVNGTIDNEQMKIFMLVDSATSSVTLYDKVVVSENATWKLYRDALGQSEIPTKIATTPSGELANGNNLFYIVVTNASGIVNTYELTIHRSFTVKINYAHLGTIFYTDSTPTGYEYALKTDLRITGYDLKAWQKDGVACTKFTPWENTTFVADASPKTYLVNLDANGGYVSVTSQEITFDSHFSLPVPYRDFYSFSGWFYGNSQITKEDGKSLSVWKIDNDITLTARWKADIFSITYELDGGTNSSDNPSSYSIEDEIALKSPTKTGHDFKTWLLNGSPITLIRKGTTGDLLLKATWSPHTNNVTIVSNDTSLGRASGSGVYAYGTNVTVTATPTRNDILFTGWYEGTSLVSTSNPYTFSMPDRAISLTARFDIGYSVSLSPSNISKGAVSGGGYYVPGTKVTIAATQSGQNIFRGWYENDELVTIENPYTFTMPNHSLTYVAKFSTDDEETAWKKEHGIIPSLSSNGSTLTYGMYPQTKISDSQLIASLSALAPKQNGEYYVFENNYYAKVNSASPASYSYDQFKDGTKIESGKTYWFKVEPIKWRVLTANNGNYQVVSDSIISLHRYNEGYDGKRNNRYASNYQYSEIRTWLNGTLYEQMFSLSNGKVQTTTVDNSASTTLSSSSWYGSASTQDKVFLLSYVDCKNSSFGFGSDTSRRCKPTDYAKAIGLYADKGNNYSSYKDCSNYWTRSPSTNDSYSVSEVNYSGALYSNVVGNETGVRPAVTIRI